MKVNEVFPFVTMTALKAENRGSNLPQSKIDFFYRPGCLWEGPIPSNMTYGACGCSEAFRLNITEAKGLGVDSTLIFEDDVVLCDDFERKFSEFIDDAPPDWELIYLGWRKDCPPEITCGVNAKLNRVSKMFCTHAVAVRSTVYDMILSASETPKVPIDFVLIALQEHGRAYCPTDNIAWQSDAPGDVEHGEGVPEAMPGWREWLRAIPGWEFMK